LSRRPTPEGVPSLTSKLRLLALVLTLAYVLVLGSAHALAGHARPRAPRAPRARAERGARHERGRRGVAPPLGLRVARFARTLLGSPYRWGGDSRAGGFDCSGLVRFVYGHFGLRLPHSSYADFGLGVKVGRRALRPGDLVFFDARGHVGIYVGENRFIHAPHSGGQVQVMSLSAPWYGGLYDGARRLLGVARQAIRGT
jgi:cell wall-associated NlpC family hydrolase